MPNNSTGRKLNTDSLDEAMKEFMDVCKLYGNKLSENNNMTRNSDINKDKNNTTGINNNRVATSVMTSLKGPDDKSKMDCDTNDASNPDAKVDKIKSINRRVSSSPYDSDSIEKLQQRQLDLQEQLNKVLEVAKGLESRRKTKLSCILEEQDEDVGQNRASQQEDDDEDDDELIEFQQIENELRVTELNRQLDNIQEELRMRLYKRLMTNMAAGSANQKNPSNQNNYRQQVCNPESENSKQLTNNVQRLVRRDSQATDESTPPSSTCSDEAQSTTTDQTTSPSSLRINQTHSNQQPATSSSSSISPTISDISQSKFNDHSCSDSSQPPATSSDSSQQRMNSFNSLTETCQNNNTRYRDTNLDNVYETIIDDETTITATKDVSLPMSGRTNQQLGCNDMSQTNGLPTQSSLCFADSYHQKPASSQGYMTSFRNVPATSDLEKIEEGEEDGQDYYNDSDRIRTIYEEKISPILRATAQKRTSPVFSMSKKHQVHADIDDDENNLDYKLYSKQSLVNNTTPKHKGMLDKSGRHLSEQQQVDEDPKTPTADFNGTVGMRHDQNNSAVTRRRHQNRPLTLYLPKPDDNELNLLEHVQALGHDPSILSEDLRITATSAQGYLRKSCANSDKKWLKRYFYFDRVSKKLSYYENEAQLVKKNITPKNSIPFDELSDVYVDHRLSILNCNELDDSIRRSSSSKKSSKKGYVFVLATTKRKYLLATAKAETMRAWIDILFTAAKANDYFQDLPDENNATIIE